MAMVLNCLPLSGYNSQQNLNTTMDLEKEDFENKYSCSSSVGGDVRKNLSSSRPPSALARGVQITEFADSRVNPTPRFLDESDILLEQYLSPGKLQLLTGVDNLETVESLELKVDSRETSLGNFGSLLPNLLELKLSGSCITSVRDLGSSLRRLHVLWLTRCGLEELDGISSMLNLKELYLEYNEISDLSPLSMLEELETLDLEGNNIDDITQVQYLSLCPKLKRLSLDGNPICVCPSPNTQQPDYDYRETVKKILPTLLLLDEVSLEGYDPSAVRHNVFDEDWAYLEELQKDSFLQEEFSDETIAVSDVDRPPTAALRPATAYRPGSALRPSSGFRPLSASRHLSSLSDPNTPRPKTSASQRPVSSDAAESLEPASELTMGSVICGNPSKALRQRRSNGPGSKEDVRRGLNKLLLKGAVLNQSTDKEEEPAYGSEELNNIIEELNSWKADHEKRMEELMKSKAAQILVVDHNDQLNSDASDDEDADSTHHDDSAGYARKRHSADLLLKKDMSLSSGDTLSTGDQLGRRQDSSEDLCDHSSSHGLKVRGDLEVEGRGVGAEEAAMFRSQSPTSAQIINSMRSKQTLSNTSPKFRKLRVGPTGLPLSSQQPVIKNSILPARPNVGPSSRPLSSKAGVSLLPSQPRIPRISSQLNSLEPRPPNSS
ncbi:uncharacterized protein LOC131937357 [Physella acuta]|uniref:uncharacterized protein LOC131937357 n=1 Tax=Physella acuta TaxID=109671 RepID=UPI0027DCCD48|nr:uncharacterized protein LOC131937357 [Physella acuta]XP_059150696.1 uncharacterized protein LOC131937357 [Physella acuta]